VGCDNKMNAEEEVAAADMCCASCGQAEIDDIKLKKCDNGCDLVKYCSDDCQNNHRPQHDEECKKRAAEIRDRDLFTQPDESHLGDCPICCLPLSICTSESSYMSCCSKSICLGCAHANQMREMEAGLRQRCAFCREPAPKSKEENKKRVMERVKKNCPIAMGEMGKTRRREGDYETALEYLTKAAELGNAEAHHNLSCLYHDGEGVKKDMKRAFYHSEKAAIGGHPYARHILGCEKWGNGRFERAKKHFTIAATLGYHDSLNNIMALYKDGNASKEDYANALRAYQAAVEAMKSTERKKAEEAVKSGNVKTF
jgi:hypothetical protein